MRPLLLTLLVLVAVSVGMTMAAIVYGVVTVGVLYPEPTPAQAVEQRYHLGVCDRLMICAGFCWLMTILAGMVFGVVWARRSKRDRSEDA